MDADSLRLIIRGLGLKGEAESIMIPQCWHIACAGVRNSGMSGRRIHRLSPQLQQDLVYGTSLADVVLFSSGRDL